MVKAGRPRRYDLRPVPGFVSDDAAYAVAALDELSARLCDMIGDLEQDALDYIPPGTTNSIAMLVVHMAWAEAGWISRVAGTSVDPELETLLLPGKQGSGGELLVSSYSVAELTALCHRVRQEVTIPALAVLDGIDCVVPDERRPMTARGVLMHLIWHWTYHSGQVGLLRRQWGARYQWTFDKQVGDVPGEREKEEA
jgi:uncharacterized damage-inducible protein DinB